MRFGPRQDVEREGQQAVAGEDRGRLVERLVRGRLAAPQVVVVHRRQVVVHQRIAVHAFERRTGHQRALARHVEQRGALHDQKRAEALAAAERGVAHRVEQPVRARELARGGLRRQQAVEQPLGIRRNAGELRLEALRGQRSSPSF